MANYNDNDLEELDFNDEEQKPEAGSPEPKKSGNRNFLVALGVIGGIFVLLTAAIIVVATMILPQRNRANQQAAQQTLAANTATAVFATEEAKMAIIVLSATPIPSATLVSLPPTNTPVVAPTQTNTPAAQATTAATATQVSDAQKATLSAQQTLMAEGKFTATVIATSTALPDTGFTDDLGLPGLLGLAAGLVLIIILARRLRSSPNAAR